MTVETPQILLIENEQSIIDQVTTLIEKIGFNKPRIASTAEEVRILVNEKKPDLALVDFSLDSAADGRDMARMLYEDYNLPVVYLATADEGMGQVKTADSYGYILKPVDQRNLKKSIMLAISRHSLLDNFAALITQLTVPAVFIESVSNEVLICNEAFSECFPGIKKHDRLTNLQASDVDVISTLKTIIADVNQSKKPVIVNSTLVTSGGTKTYDIFARLIESMGQSAVTFTFVEKNRLCDESFEHSPVMQMQIDTRGTIQAVNHLWLEKTGYSAADIVGQSITSVISDTSVKRLSNVILPGLASGKPVAGEELEVQKPDGLIISFPVFFSFLPQSSIFLIAFFDPSTISAIQKAREEDTLANALRDSAAALTSTLNFDEVLDRILVNVGEVVPNEAANVMMIWSGVAYIVRSIGYAERGIEEAMMSLQIPITQESHFLSMYTTGMPLAVGDMKEYAALESHSDVNWARSMASAPLRSKGQVFGFLNLESSQPGFYSQQHADRLQAFADQAAVAIENARLYAEVQQYAITDELTDIYNRRGLFELGRREVERARRYGRNLSAVMIDTDKFKEINDNYSHAVGDHVLRALADRWKSSIREVDILGRYGGDEFVVLLPETDLENALQVADRLRLAICSKPIETPVAELPLTVSIGVATLTETIKTFDELIEKADEAMFRSKTSGRNMVNI
jgi:diguanylate cyclase (GGDEF)-like protein/PAS domain S-box-containing protein